MIALIGYSRFPVFYSSSGREILGSKSGSIEFDDYVREIRDGWKGKALLIHTLSDVKMKSRFVVLSNPNCVAINPALSVKENVPSVIFNYPDREPDETLKNVYARGIILKGVRYRIFTPLIALRELERGEVNSLLNITRVKKFGLERMVEFLRGMGISVEVRELVDRYEFSLRDPRVNEEYIVYTDEKGRVVDANFCVELRERLYLPELVILVRERGSVYVWH